MVGDIIFIFIEFLIHSTILLALLWVMIKIQKFDYNFPALLGSAFLAGGLDLIPHFGHMIAVPVLYFCIWKLTNTSIFPDAAFTVVVAYALNFCVNLFIIGVLMGNLRPGGGIAGNEENSTQELVAVSQPATHLATNQPPMKPAQTIAGRIHVKGVTKNSGQSTVAIQYDARSYSISLGESVSVQTDDGPATVRFASLDEKSVALAVKGEQVKYPLPQ